MTEELEYEKEKSKKVLSKIKFYNNKLINLKFN